MDLVFYQLAALLFPATITEFPTNKCEAILLPFGRCALAA